MKLGNFHMGFLNPKSVTIREVVLNPAYQAWNKFEPISQIINMIFGGFAVLKIYANNPEKRVAFAPKESDVQRFFLDNIERIWLKYQLEGEVFLGITELGKLYISDDPTQWRITSTLFDEYGVIPNTMLANAIKHYEMTINVDEAVLADNGVVGIVSPKTTSNDNFVFMPEDAKELEHSFNDNGLRSGQKKYIFTEKPFEFSQPNNVLSTLDFTEKQKHTFLVLCDKLRVPKELFAVSSESTYENRQLAKVDFYTNCILPFANKVIECINKIYGEVFAEADKFYIAENEIAEIAELNKTQQYAARSAANGIVQLFQAGLITREEARKNIEDVYFLDNEQK